MIYEVIPSHKIVVVQSTSVSGNPSVGIQLMTVEPADVKVYPSVLDFATEIFPTVQVAHADATDQSKFVFVVYRAANKIANDTRRGLGRMIIRSVSTKFNLSAPAFLDYNQIVGDLVPDDVIILVYDGANPQLLDGGAACVVNDDGSCQAYAIDEQSGAVAASAYGVVMRIGA